MAPRSDKEKAARQDYKKRAKERRIAMGLPPYTEAITASRKASKKRYKEKQKVIRAAAKAERLRLRAEAPPRVLTEEERELQRAKNRAYYYANLDKERVRSALKKAQRKALRKDMTEFDKFVFSEAQYLRIARNKSTSCEWHVDHIVPIKKGGTNIYNNIQVVPAIWNLKKNASHSERYFNNGI